MLVNRRICGLTIVALMICMSSRAAGVSSCAAGVKASTSALGKPAASETVVPGAASETAVPGAAAETVVPLAAAASGTAVVPDESNSGRTVMATDLRALGPGSRRTWGPESLVTFEPGCHKLVVNGLPSSRQKQTVGAELKHVVHLQPKRGRGTLSASMVPMMAGASYSDLLWNHDCMYSS